MTFYEPLSSSQFCIDPRTKVFFEFFKYRTERLFLPDEKYNLLSKIYTMGKRLRYSYFECLRIPRDELNELFEAELRAIEQEKNKPSPDIPN